MEKNRKSETGLRAEEKKGYGDETKRQKEAAQSGSSSTAIKYNQLREGESDSQFGDCLKHMHAVKMVSKKKQ